MGCGACATVCPSGAMSYAYPSVPQLGQQIRTLLATYAKAGGRDACLLLHAEDGRAAIARIARRGRGLPARVIPLEVHHVAAVGIDVWLAALALGASQVAVLATGAEAPQYREALDRQMAIADRIAQGLGYQGEHFRVFDGEDAAALRRGALVVARGVAGARRGLVRADRRQADDRGVRNRASRPPRAGAAARDRAAGRRALRHDCRQPRHLHDVPRLRRQLPVGAILDTQEKPQLRFIEAKCVQCGLCATTCPEQAITLTPRLNLAPEAKTPRVLNEAALFQCIACGKPMGTAKMVEAMLGRLAGHSMFAAPGALDRLRMCADCRVIDMMKNESGTDVRDR